MNCLLCNKPIPEPNIKNKKFCRLWEADKFRQLKNCKEVHRLSYEDRILYDGMKRRGLL